MPTMNISLPEHLKEYVDEQVDSGKYTSVSEYMRELVRLDQKSREREKIELQVLEGLASGDAVELTPRMLDELRRKLRSRRKRAS
jgi:antitoxin ParD1/3/4